MTRYQSVSPDALDELLVERIAALTGRVRVAVDGPRAADPAGSAGRLVDPLRVRGRSALVVRAETFWRDASLRLEYGREDVDAYYNHWLDTGTLGREVLTGSGPVLPSLRDPATNRATRAAAVELPDDGVVLLAGSLLLGHGLPFELTVHLALSPGARARRTPTAERWTLPALDRYDREIDPTAIADIAVRYDDPAHPALRIG